MPTIQSSQAAFSNLIQRETGPLSVLMMMTRFSIRSSIMKILEVNCGNLRSTRSIHCRAKQPVPALSRNEFVTREAYYASEEKARLLEKRWSKAAIAVVMIAENGKATLKDVILNQGN
jgi:hypothetical protein